ncbi:MAG: universal stress protein [Gemmatimonadetes bacterium]|nr:universal stress protein [Gemmatimonadota bacterium]
MRHLLVPLDGSHLAEAVLPVTAVLADRLGASVTLLHVLERNAPAVIHGARHLRTGPEAEAYLTEAAGRAFVSPAKVARHVHTAPEADIAQSIAAHAPELGSDLIVMCTHGRGGLRHRIFGSNAQRVVRLGIPVLLVPPPSPTGKARAFECRRVLVTISAREDDERALDVATDFAGACGAFLHLLYVVPTPATLSGEEAALRSLLPGTTAELLGLEERGARGSLSRQLARLEAFGDRVAGEVARGDPATVILDRARVLAPDLIVAGTHGKAGMEAFWAGSVAARVAEQSEIPVLLVPARPGPRSGPA